jgi:hypothetical protein
MVQVELITEARAAVVEEVATTSSHPKVDHPVVE